MSNLAPKSLAALAARIKQDKACPYGDLAAAVLATYLALNNLATKWAKASNPPYASQGEAAFCAGLKSATEQIRTLIREEPAHE